MKEAPLCNAFILSDNNYTFVMNYVLLYCFYFINLNIFYSLCALRVVEQVLCLILTLLFSNELCLIILFLLY